MGSKRVSKEMIMWIITRDQDFFVGHDPTKEELEKAVQAYENLISLLLFMLDDNA